MVDDGQFSDHGASGLPRRRMFVAGGARPPAAAMPVEPLPELPVLTEIVDPTAPLPLPAEVAIPAERVEALARTLLAELLPRRQQQVADALGAWLDGELAPIVMHVLDGLTDHIVAQVTADVRASLIPALQAALEKDPQTAENVENTE
jgi:hypothetical protein